jgi:hypothetical protein
MLELLVKLDSVNNMSKHKYFMSMSRTKGKLNENRTN